MEERASHNSEFSFPSISEFPFQLSSEALEEGKRLGNIAANFVKGGELESEEVPILPLTHWDWEDHVGTPGAFWHHSNLGVFYC